MKRLLVKSLGIFSVNFMKKNGMEQVQETEVLFYSSGEGVTKNKEEAVKWYRQAAQQGHAPAQYNLALAYSSGHGVIQNKEESSYWLDKAAAGNCPPAAMLKNPSLATLKAALSSSSEGLAYLFQYGLKKFGLVF